MSFSDSDRVARATQSSGAACGQRDACVATRLTEIQQDSWWVMRCVGIHHGETFSVFPDRACLTEYRTGSMRNLPQRRSCRKNFLRLWLSGCFFQHLHGDRCSSAGTFALGEQFCGYHPGVGCIECLLEIAGAHFFELQLFICGELFKGLFQYSLFIVGEVPETAPGGVLFRFP